MKFVPFYWLVNVGIVINVNYKSYPLIYLISNLIERLFYCLSKNVL